MLTALYKPLRRKIQFFLVVVVVVVVVVRKFRMIAMRLNVRSG